MAALQCVRVGGSVPVFDEVILSTSLMNKVVKLDKTAGIAFRLAVLQTNFSAHHLQVFWCVSLVVC